MYTMLSLCIHALIPGLIALFPPQKEFMRHIQSSGVLVVLSQAWIEELYHQVLEHNLLGEAGYWDSPEDHSLPLITMLTGNSTLLVTYECVNGIQPEQVYRNSPIQLNNANANYSTQRGMYDCLRELSGIYISHTSYSMRM